MEIRQRTTAKGRPKAPKMRVTCSVCGAVFERYAHLLKGRDTYYCSRACTLHSARQMAAAKREINKALRELGGKELITMVCLHCENKYRIERRNKKYRAYQFCSDECWYLFNENRRHERDEWLRTNG
jgi:hypothetical protein